MTIDNANPFSNLTLIVEPRLTSDTAWYLCANPAQLESIEYAYLAGAPGPQTETQAGFRIDGVETKVRLDSGCGVVDFRGMVKTPGV